jgi:nucleoside-diphosphate-sugar epimerase
MKILFTGASSFTGYWFVKALAKAGHEIVCPLQGAPGGYDGVRRRRVEELRPLCRLVPLAPFGSESFSKLAQEAAPWDLLCHHGAYAVNYKSPDFDAQRALESNTLNLPGVLAGLRERGLKAVVLTGSVFENDEGLGNEPLRAFSPYGLSKGLTWQSFRYYCARAQVPLAKFVIANPFGPFEEARFTAYLMRTWREGKSAGVKTPLYVRDNIPVDLLAQVYRQFAERAFAPGGSSSKLNPSGYIESQGAFAWRLAREIKARLGWACAVDLARQEDFSEPLVRVNSEPACLLVPDWKEPEFWDGFAKYYASPP